MTTPPRLPHSPVSIRTINAVQSGCLCVSACSGVYGCLTHSCWAHSQGLAANTFAHMRTCLRHRKTPALAYQVCMYRLVTQTKIKHKSLPLRWLEVTQTWQKKAASWTCWVAVINKVDTGKGHKLTVHIHTVYHVCHMTDRLTGQ